VWQNHVLAHQPFYHILFPVFIDLMLATVDASTDMVLRECLAVAQVRLDLLPHNNLACVGTMACVGTNTRLSLLGTLCTSPSTISSFLCLSTSCSPLWTPRRTWSCVSASPSLRCALFLQHTKLASAIGIRQYTP
jgi:hypothetical protein